MSSTSISSILYLNGLWEKKLLNAKIEYVALVPNTYVFPAIKFSEMRQRDRDKDVTRKSNKTCDSAICNPIG